MWTAAAIRRGILVRLIATRSWRGIRDEGWPGAARAVSFVVRRVVIDNEKWQVIVFRDWSGRLGRVLFGWGDGGGGWKRTRGSNGRGWEEG
jgi:transposase